jgi:hypothetical protein
MTADLADRKYGNQGAKARFSRLCVFIFTPLPLDPMSLILTSEPLPLLLYL